MLLQKRVVTLCLVAMLASCGTALAQQDTETESATVQDNAAQPNILFIMTDDHAAHAISAYGSKINQTPHMDRLAREGMLFNNSFVTNSLCGPCRAVILTGKYSHENGFMKNGDRFDGSQQTYPKLLQQAGYQTAVVGKWHLGTDPTGFDYWHVLNGQGPYYNPRMKTPGGQVAHEGYTTEIITDLALEWLDKKRDTSKPFMMMYQHKAPHRNWQPGPKYLTMYDDVTLPEPDDLFDDYSGRGTPAKTQEMTIAEHLNANDLKLRPPRNLTPEQLKLWNAAYEPKNEAFRNANLTGKDLVRWKYQRYMKDYLRCVAAVDDGIGEVLDYLDENGLADNTIVVYTSDQGFFLGDHGWYDKRFMYEEALRSPLLVRWPGQIKPGTVNDDIVLNLDFAETFLDAAGVEVPADMHGRSMLPILKGNTPTDWRTSMYYHYYEYPAVHQVRRHYGVRTATHKLIYFYNIDEWELFDMENDPEELNSVYGSAEYAGVQAELTDELNRLREQFAVPEDTRPFQRN